MDSQDTKDEKPKETVKEQFLKEGYNKLHKRIRGQVKKEVVQELGVELFVPSEDQKRFLEAALNPDTGDGLDEWIKAAGVSKASVTLWKRNQGFIDWFVSETEHSLAFYKVTLLKTGLKKAQLDFKHWEKMIDFLYPDGIKFSKQGEEERTSLENDLLKVLMSNQGGTS